MTLLLTQLAALKDEFSKIAEENKKTRNVGAGIGTALGSEVVPAAAGQIYKKEIAKVAPDRPELTGAIAKMSPAPIHEAKANVFAGDFKMSRKIVKNMGLVPGAVHVTPGAGAATLAHEIGHAKIDKSRFGRLLQNPITGNLGHHAPTLGLISGLATGGSDDARVRKAGVIAPALATLPRLAYEGGATISALRDLKRGKATPAELSGARARLGKAFGTYAGHAAAAPGMAYAGQQLRARDRSQDK